MAITLTVRAGSRFKKAATAYNDQVKQGHNANSINPTTRRIGMTASGLPILTRTLEWRAVRRSDGRLFSRSKTTPFNISGPRSDGLNLPSEDVYDCQVVATLHDGKKQQSPLASISLRDSLGRDHRWLVCLR